MSEQIASQLLINSGRAGRKIKMKHPARNRAAKKWGKVDFFMIGIFGFFS